jgi:hypothetical protein
MLGDADRPNLARGLSKASALSSNSNTSLNDSPLPSSTPHGYFSTVAQPAGSPAFAASLSSHLSTGSMNAFADQSRYSSGGVPLPQVGSPRLTPVSSPRKESSLIPGSPRTVPIFAPVTMRKDPDIVPLPQRNAQRSPTITEGIYELDANPRSRGLGARELEIKEFEASDVVNPFMKPETKKDAILKEVREAKERIRKEEVAPLEERLRALEAMVLRMAQQENGR